MKKLRLALASLVAAGLVGVTGSARPASAFFFSYTSGIQVQNLAATNASIVITFYDAAGATAGTTSDTIPANGSMTYFPLSAVPAGFNGSAVVSSDQQVAAVVNVLGNNGVAAASYIGFSAGGTTLQIPLLMKGNFGFNTWFKVQNTGSAATNITANYSDGTTATQNNIAPGASATFDQATETHGAAVFAATVTASQPVVASVVEESTTTMFAYNSFTNAGSTFPVMPLVNANYFGYITGIQIKNGGASATSVTVSYAPSLAGAACTETQNVAPGASTTFALNAFSVAGTTTSDCTFGSTFQGTARVTGNSASMPLSAIVNQLNNSVGTGEAYSGFDPATATAKLVMPLIMDRNFGYFTGFNVMNVGAAATTVTCTFTNSSRTVSANVPAGAALTDVQNNQIAANYTGSATCTAGAGGQIAGIVNELGAGPGDQFLVYEAINQ